jgi:hypothetical protein
VSIQEDIKSRDLVGLLIAIAREGESGILTVQGHDEIIALSFMEGQVVSADALNQPLEDGLGQILSEDGMVSPEDFAALAGEYQAGGGRVIDLLVERRFVSQEQLLDVLRLHYYQLCRQVLGWSDGEFKFYKGDEISYEEGVEALPVEEVMVRVSLDGGGVSSRIESMPRLETVLERTNQNPPESDPASALAELVGPDLPSTNPGEDALSLLERVDGSRSADALAQESGLEAFSAQLTLFRLQEAGFIRQVVAPVQEDAPSLAPLEAVATAPTVVEFPVESHEEKSAEEGMIGEISAAPVEVGSLDDDSSPLGPIPFFEESIAPSRDSVVSRTSGIWTGRVAELVSGLLAAGLAAVLIFLVVTNPGRFLAPLQEQENLRLEMENDRRASVYLKIDRAAKTFYLLDGLFPNDLETLVERRLLSEADLRLGDRETLFYSASPAAYQITRRSDESEYSDSPVFTETIDGNFLLDPEFVIRSDQDVAPLVLLD